MKMYSQKLIDLVCECYGHNDKAVKAAKCGDMILGMYLTQDLVPEFVYDAISKAENIESLRELAAKWRKTDSLPELWVKEIENYVPIYKKSNESK